jgi:hypothetical protein
VVERIIGNDEVGSSILPCGTIFHNKFNKLHQNSSFVIGR